MSLSSALSECECSHCGIAGSGVPRGLPHQRAGLLVIPVPCRNPRRWVAAGLAGAPLMAGLTSG